MKQQSSVPILRFPEFKDCWKSKVIKNILNRVVDPVTVDPSSIYNQIGIRSHGRGIFYKDSVLGEELGNKRVFWVHPELFIVNIVFGWEQAIAKTTDKEVGMIASHRFPMYKPQDSILTTEFLLALFLTRKGKNLLELASPGGAGRNKTLGQKEFEKLKIIIPSITEQKKITTFLDAVDEKITQLSKKKELLEEYKKGMMQKIFSQEIRFKDEKGNNFPDWRIKTFNKIFERVTRKNKENNKNVMTISAQQGLVNQEEYFNKSVSASDVTGYYLLEKGEFAYNKSYSKGYPMGAIKRLKSYSKGVVSTLYICFKLTGGDVAEFYEHYFESGSQNRAIHKIAQEGARNHGLLNISVVEFFRDIKIPNPHPDEQKKIADFLSSLDQKIDATDKQLKAAQDFKKGLLQQMFV